MAITSRKPSESATDSEIERFMEANQELRESIIKGIADIDRAREYVEYEVNRDPTRKGVLGLLNRRIIELKD